MVEVEGVQEGRLKREVMRKIAKVSIYRRRSRGEDKGWQIHMEVSLRCSKKCLGKSERHSRCQARGPAIYS